MSDKITKDTTITEVLDKKGMKVAEVLNNKLCNGSKMCCYGTSLSIHFAAIKMGTEANVPELLDELNKIPDCSC